MIVVGGDNKQVFAGLAPSLLLWLMAEYKRICVKEFGHCVECVLTVVSTPGQKVSWARLYTIADFQLLLQDLLVEFIDVMITG